MKPTPSSQRCSVINLLNEGFSVHQIQSKIGLGKSTVGRIKKEVDSDKENNKGGRPSKLTSKDKQVLLCQITTGKLDNAVQATHFINNAIPSPVSAQTVRTTFVLLSNQNNLSSKPFIIKSTLNLPRFILTGLWKTGKKFSGQIKQRSTGLAQMEGSTPGNQGVKQSLIGQHHQLSSMEEATISWPGGVWAGMVLGH